MASLLTVRIAKGDSPNLGFRLQGGKDFGTPLVIQKVNVGSPAERAGLVAGDSVIKINNTDVFNLRHKDAQDVVLRAGTHFDVTVQRGGSTWKPSVLTTGSVLSQSPSINHISPVTKTSLAANKNDNWGAVGTGHNVSAKPFNPQLNGAVNGNSKVVNKQYNTPIKLYSDASIAETISAQTEVLSTGALGVNFKKNEKNYDASNSAVLRMLQESEKEPKTPEEEPDSGVVTAPNSGIAGLRHVYAPENKPAPSNPQLQPGQNICADCERLIVGVFVRIKDKNLHVECFKCSTCGTSLKNVGYYNINNKLYCDIHAKSAAIRNSPNPNLVPITVPPGGKPPAQAISSALATHSLPSPLSPKINPSFASPYQTSSNYSSAPKPFCSVNAPLSPHSTLPRTAPLSPVVPAPAPSYNTPSFTSSYSPASSAGRSVPNIVWPPPQSDPELPTACPLFYPPPSQVEQKIISKKIEQTEEEDFENAEDCSELIEINRFARYRPSMSLDVFTERKSATECIDTISETLETQKFVENILKTRTDTIPQGQSTFEPPKPQYQQKISDPKQINPQEKTSIQPSGPVSISDSTCCQNIDKCELKTHFTSASVESETSSKIDTVPLKWESPLTQAIRTTSPDPDTFSLLPPSKRGTALASALSIAPAQPFKPTESDEKPVPLPEETIPYMPPERPVIPLEEKERKPEKPKSKFVKAIETAPERPYSPSTGPLPPLPKKKDPLAVYFEDLPKPQQKLSMLAALTTAPERPYSPIVIENIDIGKGLKDEKESESSKPKIDKSQLQKPKKPEVLPGSFKINQTDPKPPGYYPPIMYQMAEETKSQEHIEETSTSAISSVEKETQYLPLLYQKTEESKLEEHTEETNTSKVTTIEKQIQNPQVTQIIIGGEEQSVPQNFAPLFHGFSCSFQNKTDHSQFSVEINTTPPIRTPPPKASTPIIKTIESQSGYVQKETVTEERHERQQVTKKQEQSKEELKANVASSKQKEEIVLIKATPQVELHRVEGLPSYQVQLAAEAEANLILLEKKRKAQEKLEQQKLDQKCQQQASQSHQQIQQPASVIKLEHLKPVQEQKTIKPLEDKPNYQQTPVIKVESDVSQPIQQQRTFKPVTEERPPSRTFSPRPGTITPSMINKPPPVLPYYQSNLVPQHMPALAVNIFDPKSPAVSRSPSPCPLLKPSSPVSHSERPVSPASGPPPNPLKSSSPLPTPADSRIAQARENISTYIPEYKSKTDLIERTEGLDIYKRSEVEQKAVQPVQMYTSTVQTQRYPLQKESVRNDNRFSEKQILRSQQQLYEAKSLELQEAQKSQRHVTQSAEGTVSTAIDEQCRLAHAEQYKQSQSQSVERSADGLTQVQRRKIVTEEFERTQKKTNIQIEKNVSSTKKYPFREVNAPAIDSPISTGVRSTDPQPIASPFIKSSPVSQQQQVQEKCQKRQTYQTCPVPSVSSTFASSAASASPKHVFATSSNAPLKHVDPPCSTKKSNQNKTDPNVSQPNSGAGTGRQAGGISVAPRRGRGVLNTAALTGSRIPLCGSCNLHIRGPFITALGKIWCPNHFICATASCRRPLQDIGFVEERGQLYCEYCFEQYLAPPCSKCNSKIKGDCLKAIGKNFHPECFNCTYCGKLFGNSPFFLEDGSPYCEADWNELFTTKCFACAFPIEAGDRWVEALNNNYHSQCFNCTMCKKNLEGQSFFAKGGRPFCKNHAR